MTAIGQAVGNTSTTQLLKSIVAANRRAKTRYRLIYSAVWAIILVVLAIALGTTGKIDFAFIQKWGGFILGGAGTTIVVCIFSITMATMLAVVGALGRLSSNPVINGVASFYVSLVRGTPLLVQIFFIYYSLPEFKIVIPGLEAGIIALGFNYGAYMTEIFRAGIQAVPKGQREAAEALAMPGNLVMRRIVLPQATRIVIPDLGNQFVAMIKDSALVSTIGVTEVLNNAQLAGSQGLQFTAAFLVAALIYWGLTIIFSTVQSWLERRMARGDR